MSSQRYRPNQQLEIYKFRVAPGLQISKELDLLMINLFYCLVMKEVFWGFGELSSIPSRSEK